MSDAMERARRLFGRAALGVALLALPGCGGVDGVELNGKVFEAVGLTGALGKRAEPKTQPRAPLVLPPTTERLPEPGEYASAEPAAVADPAWPNDPDKSKVSSEQAKKQAQEKYCRDGNWKERAMGDEEKAASGPDGSCSGNIFSAIGKGLFGN